MVFFASVWFSLHRLVLVPLLQWLEAFCFNDLWKLGCSSCSCGCFHIVNMFIDMESEEY